MEAMGDGEITYVRRRIGVTREQIVEGIEAYWLQRGAEIVGRDRLTGDAWKRDRRLLGLAVCDLEIDWLAVVDTERGHDADLARYLVDTVAATVVIETVAQSTRDAHARVFGEPAIALPRGHGTCYDDAGATGAAATFLVIRDRAPRAFRGWFEGKFADEPGGDPPG
jgi:hypothetical protein